MVAALAIVLAGALAADPVAKTDLAIAASAFARSSAPGVDDGAAGGLALIPSATTHLARRDFQLDLAYAPTLLVESGGKAFAARHELRLALSLPRSRRLELQVKLRASYGRNELLLDEGEQAPFAFLSRILPVISDLLDTEADLSSSYQLSPTLRADASLDFDAFGGLSADSQRLLPLQLGPALFFGLEQSLSPRTRIGGTALLSTTFISDERRSDAVELAATFRRDLTPKLGLSLAAGVSADRSLDDGARRSSLSPTFQAGLDARFPERSAPWELRFLGAYGPHTDPLTGELHDRLDASALARVAVRERLTLHARIGAARERRSSVEPGASLAVAGADLAYAFPGGFGLGGGAQGSCEDAPGLRRTCFWTVFTRAAWSLPNAF